MAGGAGGLGTGGGAGGFGSASGLGGFGGSGGFGAGGGSGGFGPAGGFPDRGRRETGARRGPEGMGLSVEARGRTLLAHQAEDFRELDAGFAVRLQPGRKRGGVLLSFMPSWGETSGGAQTLWGAEGGLGGFGRGSPGRGLSDLSVPRPRPDGRRTGWL